MKKTELEKKFLGNFKLFGGNRYPIPLHDQLFHDTRKWRLDYVWPDSMIAVEVQGGQWMPKGGHNSGSGLQRDCEKYNEAQLKGWKVFLFSTSMLDESKYYKPLFQLLPKVR